MRETEVKSGNSGCTGTPVPVLRMLRINVENKYGIDPLIQPSLCTGTQKKARSGEWYYVLFLSLLGLYADAVVYGFQYPARAAYNFFLPMANWFRDPSLYPGDPIR